MYNISMDTRKPAVFLHRTDLGVGVGIANQGQARERVSAGRQSTIFGPDEAVVDDGVASLGQAAELASRAGER